MYTIDDLNVRLLSELKEIAEQLGVKNAKKLAKQDLVYKILDQQAITEPAPTPKKTSSNGNGDKTKPRPRRRENVAPAAKAEKTEKELSSEELLESIDAELDSTVTSFEKKPEPAKQNTQNRPENNKGNRQLIWPFEN